MTSIHKYLSSLRAQRGIELDEDDPLWLDRNLTPLRDDNIRRTLDRIGKRVGINLYAHRLRDTCATIASWRMMPHDLPPWYTVYQQTRRWLKAGVFEAMVHDLRMFLRLAEGKQEQPTAVILDTRTLQSTPESGARAGYDGHKRKRGSKRHMAVDTLGHLLALHVTPANEQDRSQGRGVGDAGAGGDR